jgi:hypothetical protein
MATVRSGYRRQSALAIPDISAIFLQNAEPTRPALSLGCGRRDKKESAAQISFEESRPIVTRPSAKGKRGFMPDLDFNNSHPILVRQRN